METRKESELFVLVREVDERFEDMCELVEKLPMDAVYLEKLFVAFNKQKKRALRDEVEARGNEISEEKKAITDELLLLQYALTLAEEYMLMFQGLLVSYKVMNAHQWSQMCLDLREEVKISEDLRDGLAILQQVMAELEEFNADRREINKVDITCTQ